MEPEQTISNEQPRRRSRSEIHEFLRDHQHRERVQLQKLAELARMAVPVLKDHGCANVALEIDRELFQLDALRNEFGALVRADPEAMVAALLPEK